MASMQSWSGSEASPVGVFSVPSANGLELIVGGLEVGD